METNSLMTTLNTILLPLPNTQLNLEVYAGLILITVSLSLVLWGEYKEKPLMVLLFKPLASLGFLYFAYASHADWSTPYPLAILVALILSAIGDVLLIKQNDHALLLGLAAFLLGHVAYSVACLSHINEYSLLMILLLVSLISGIFAYRYFAPHMSEELRIPSMAYIAVIAVMVASTLNKAYLDQSLTLGIAGIAFWCSDISVARARFMQSGFVNRLWGLPLYYWAQVLFACTLYKL
jgi:uncharacterized membrane protein YhhN